MVNFTLRQLVYLLALNETRSFSKAAEKCHVTQSTLSLGIKELESLLNARLFERHGKTVLPTPTGQIVLTHAKRICAEAEGLMQSVSGTLDPMTGVLRLGIIPTIAPYLLPNLLSKLHAYYPDLSLSITENLSHHLVEKLNRGELDVVLMAFPYDVGGLSKHIIFDDPFVLAVRNDRKKQNAQDYLDQETLLLLQDGHCLKDHILEACNLTKTERPALFEASSLQTLLALTEQGIGVTLLPKMMVYAPHMQIAETVKLIEMPKPAPSREIGFCTRPSDQRATQVCAILSEFLKL